MASTHRGRTYEVIKADLLAEAQAVGLHSKGAVLDPVLELLINGFARELESIYGRVSQALEYNRRTLLRNFFETPFLESPAQTVIGLQVREKCLVGSDMRVTWRKPVGPMTPEYVVLSEREMVPLTLSAAFYWVGDSVFRISWDGELKMTSRRYTAPGRVAARPRLLLGLTSSQESIDTRHLSFLLQPDDAGISAIFPGVDPLRSYAEYLDASNWLAADTDGTFSVENVLTALGPATDSPGSHISNRFPTEASFLASMASEHIYAPVVRRFAPGKRIGRAPLPNPVREMIGDHEDLADVAALAKGAFWLTAQLPHVVAEDPRSLFSVIATNARLAIGYRRDPPDRFNFAHNDYNLQSQLFEFGLADRPGQYCKTYGHWVVQSLVDMAGNEYPYVYDAISRGIDRWFTLEVGADDVTLIVHIPRRKVPEVGSFDLCTGHIIGPPANTPCRGVLAPRPANGLDFPEVEDLRLLVPAHAGGDGFEATSGEPDSLMGGAARVLERQYTRAAIWLRTHDRLTTLPDLESFLHATDRRVREVHAARVSLEREGNVVPGVQLNVRFDKEAKLSSEEQEAICQLATRQIEKRVPVGMWVVVRPNGDEVS
ncbi:hypothetical protein ACFL6M_05045 [Candidatus Eisenbacteria bacterium]|uniref:Baseplate protein J-like domain-containing protein n=1 Tax=Eiseniibacteriota bacterium TaxID=2212470 RepID=A0ABV6YKU4_UNCEI